MSTRAKWSIVWGGWLAYFIAAETIALRSHEYDAPLSAHMRYALAVTATGKRRHAGKVAYVSGAIWLLDHLYRGVKSSV